MGKENKTRVQKAHNWIKEVSILRDVGRFPVKLFEERSLEKKKKKSKIDNVVQFKRESILKSIKSNDLTIFPN